MDTATTVFWWLVDFLSALPHDVWDLLVAVTGNPVGRWIAAPTAVIVIALVLMRLPLLWSRKLAFELRKTPGTALKLGEICLVRGERHTKRGDFRRALEHLDLAISALTDVKTPSDSTHSLYIKCLDARALVYERSENPTRWSEAEKDLNKLLEPPLTQTRTSRAAWLRRLASAENNLGKHAKAQEHLQDAVLLEKNATASANASPILQMWPLVEHLVLTPARDSVRLKDALADVKALRDLHPTDGNTAYAKALLEFAAGDAAAVSSLTKAAALLPPDFVKVYYWRARARAVAGDLRGCLEDCAKASSSTELGGAVRCIEGFAQFGLGQFDEAVRRYALALETEPSLPDAHQGLVVSRARLRQWEQVIADSDRAIQAGIIDAVIYSVRGETALNLGNLEQAITECSHALELSANGIGAYRVRGATYLQLQQWANAIVDLTAALKLDDKDAISYAYRTEAHRMQGEIASASEDADLAVSYGKDLVIARLVRVLITLRRWEVEQQESLLVSAEQDSAWMVATEPATALGYWAQALVMRARGKTKQALRLTTQALKHDPQFTNAYQTRGWLHSSMAAWSKATDDFRTAIKFGGPANLGESYFGLAECQRINGEPQLSIGTYDKAIEIAPNYSFAYYGRGLAYVAVGRWTEALENYTAAIIRGLRVSELYRARAWMHFYSGLDESALADFMDASELASSPTDTLLDWASVLVVVGQPAAGVQKFSEILEVEPNSDTAYANRGWARGVNGDLEGAVEDESKAIELNPKIATHFNNRAWALCKLERWADAVNDCDRAIALDKSLDYAFKNRSLARWCLDNPDDALSDLTEMVRLRQSTGTAPATGRGDLFNWRDQAGDWAKALTSREGNAVGFLGYGIALWMSGQLDPADENIRRAIDMNSRLQTGTDVLRAIAEHRVKSLAVHNPR